MQVIKYIFLVIFLLFIKNSSLSQTQINNEIQTFITLEQAMDLAENNSFNVKTAAQDLNYYDHSETLSYFNIGPSIGISGDLTFAEDQRENYNSNIPSQSESVALEVNQPLTGLITELPNLMAKKSLRKAANFDLFAERIKAREKAAEYFLNVQQAYRNIDIKKTELTSIADQLKETKILFESGDENKTKIDLLQFQAKYIESEIKLSQAENELQNKISELKTFLNINSNLKLSYENKSYFELRNKPIEKLENIIKKGKTNRNEIKSLENKISAEKYNLLHSSSNYLPKINAFARNSYEKSTQTASPNDPNYTYYPQTKFTYGLSLKWNIWDGGIIADNQMSILNKKRKLILDKEQSELAISQEIILAYNNFKNFNENLIKSKEAVQISEEALKLSLLKYQTGDLSASELILVQNSLTNSKINLAEMRNNLDISWLKLQASLGDIPKITQ
ncbi:TolC family protein [Fluviispira sanaruensis]|uniref:TolC family protein n=1 Tax=Fluviispira sanaruensis TaxID=2493639 RepID=A0A4P2VFY5_FLUSA|nr:TolC family protein [Fluviispira sanaruensis]BBH51743.1 TolC family protein [Fluviispira sanaruensis]